MWYPPVMFIEDYQVNDNINLLSFVYGGVPVTIFLRSNYLTQILCFSEVRTLQQYFPVFDKLRKEFLVRELI